VQVPVGNSQGTLDDSSTYATPLDSVKRILQFMWSKSPKTLLDLGSGDGRLVVNWAMYTGYPAIGIESDPERVALSRAFAERKGVSHLVTIIQADYTRLDLPKADAVYIYQFEEDLAAIRDKLTRYNHVVSFAHQIPGLSMTSHNNGEFFSWKKQPRTSKATGTIPSVWYDGKEYDQYHLPSGGRCNCYPMCQQIKAALRAQGVNI
jgi:SAM-dependent methyltransferase